MNRTRLEARETFDRIADAYDAVRPTYPDTLFDDLAHAAEIAPSDSILEIGCGTGLATQSLARWNCHVVALDPGPELLRVARVRLAAFSNIEWIQSSFETWPADESSFKLVIAAQAFHWIAPDRRFVKSASVLRPDGILAVFGNVPLPFAAPLYEDIQRAYARYAPRLVKPPAENWYLPNGPITAAFADSRLFAEITHRSYPWRRSHTAASYTNLLRSHSDHQLLPAEQRDALLAAIAEAIEIHGGEFALPYEAHLYFARRVSQPPPVKSDSW